MVGLCLVSKDPEGFRRCPVANIGMLLTSHEPSRIKGTSEGYIKSLLNKYLPKNNPVYIFGSRARNDARWNSDYDLWVDAEIDWQTLMRIKEELEESFVSFKVDIVQKSEIKGEFGELVKAEAKKWM